MKPKRSAGAPKQEDVSRFQRRDEILGITTTREDNVVRFGRLDLERLETLVLEEFIDLDQKWNDAPTARALLSFIRSWPWVRAHGYAIHPSREDYGVTLEGLECELSEVPDSKRCDLRYAFSKQWGGADEFKDGLCWLWAWWD